MGCWNGTCGISQLPIFYHDDVVALLIGIPPVEDREDSDGYSGVSYSDTFAYPMSLPFRAVYNDYGGLEAIEEGLATRLIQKRFAETCYPVKNFEEFINDYVERDKVTWSPYAKQANTHGVGLFMMKASIADAFTNDKRHSLRLSAKRLAKKLQKELKAYLKGGGESKAIFQITEARWFIEDRKEEFSWAIKPSHGLRQSGLRDLTSEFVDLALDLPGSQAKFDELVEAVIDLRKLHETMESLRKLWVPQAGKGSQDDFEEHVKLIKLMKRDIQKTLEDRW